MEDRAGGGSPAAVQIEQLAGDVRTRGQEKDRLRDIRGLANSAPVSGLHVGVVEYVCGHVAAGDGGRTTLTRTPDGPHSAASARAAASSAPFDAEYRLFIGLPRLLSAEEMVTMLPPPDRAMCPAA